MKILILAAALLAISCPCMADDYDDYNDREQMAAEAFMSPSDRTAAEKEFDRERIEENLRRSTEESYRKPSINGGCE